MSGKHLHVPPKWAEYSSKNLQGLGVTDEKAWVQTQLRLSASQYTEARDITVALCSWNIDQSKPGPGMGEWLQVKKRPDVVAIGLQELDMSVSAMANQVTPAHEPWLKRLRHEMGINEFDKESYIELNHQQLVGLFLIVFVKAELKPHVGDVAIRTVCTGAMSGALGNKGGIGLSFRLFTSQFCAINAHLAAHMNPVDKRNQNFQQIVSQLHFPKRLEGDEDTQLPCLGHDYVFFFCDLH